MPYASYLVDHSFVFRFREPFAGGAGRGSRELRGGRPYPSVFPSEVPFCCVLLLYRLGPTGRVFRSFQLYKGLLTYHEDFFHDYKITLCSAKGLLSSLLSLLWRVYLLNEALTNTLYHVHGVVRKFGGLVWYDGHLFYGLISIFGFLREFFGRVTDVSYHLYAIAHRFSSLVYRGHGAFSNFPNAYYLGKDVRKRRINLAYGLLSKASSILSFL